MSNLVAETSRSFLQAVTEQTTPRKKEEAIDSIHSKSGFYKIKNPITPVLLALCLFVTLRLVKAGLKNTSKTMSTQQLPMVSSTTEEERVESGDDSNLFWTKDTKQREELHPTLQRNYSTIGIGAVFASGPPNHPLPVSYLENGKLFDADESDCDETFLSTELVGEIKSCPEDFIVREIGLGDKQIPGLTEEEQQELRTAALQELRRDLWVVQPRPDKAQALLPPETVPEPRQDECSLEVVLKGQLALCEQSCAVIWKALCELDTRAQAILQGAATKSDNDEMNITPLTNIEHTLDRALFHNAFRAVFPLLFADSVSRPQERLGEEKVYVIRVTIDDRFHDLLPSLLEPMNDLVALYSFFKRKVIREYLNASTSLRLKADIPRDARRPIHETISNKSNKSLSSSTITGAVFPNGSSGVSVSVQWSKNACRRAVGKQSCQKGDTGLDIYPHTLFVMKKTQKEHLTALRTLQRAIQISISDVGVAGIKDMQAVTYQFVTLANTSPQRLVREAEFLKTKGIDIGTVFKVDWKLNKGFLKGNRFEIVLRNVRRVKVVRTKGGVTQEHLVATDMSHVQQMIDRVRQNGFINFYGTQRVGEPGCPSVAGVRTFDIGRAMLQQDFSKAIDLLVTGRGVCRGSEMESDQVRTVRDTWKLSGGDVNATFKKLPRNSSMARERTILQGLKRYGEGNPLAAIRCLSYNERMFWVSGYQSLVFNLMATKRLELYGAKVVPGDLILMPGAASVVEVTESTFGDFTLYDVVLPLPGFGIRYPSNDIGRLYEQTLLRDCVSFQSKEGVPPESTAKGGYRRLLERAMNLECSQVLLAEDDELHVKMKFDLPAGCYATMLLREVMLGTVVREC